MLQKYEKKPQFFTQTDKKFVVLADGHVVEARPCEVKQYALLLDAQIRVARFSHLMTA
jgi:hypothetical protein